MLHNLVQINEKVQIGDQKYIQATQKGSLVLQLNDKTQLRPKEVLVVPKLAKNLISEAVLQKTNKIFKFGDTWQCFPVVTTKSTNKHTFGKPLTLQKSSNTPNAFLPSS